MATTESSESIQGIKLFCAEEFGWGMSNLVVSWP